MNAVIETIIAQVLSPYLEGISRENLRLGILAGEVRLDNLKVKDTIFARLGLPQCTLETASVSLVTVSIPWSNPRTGKIVIAVSGVAARARYSSVLDHSTQIRIKRELIDSIKKSLAVETGKSFTSNWLVAKLGRKLFSALTVTVTDIQISAVLAPPPEESELDEDGFADATSVEPEELDECELLIKIKSVSIETPLDSASPFSKSLCVSEFSLAILPVNPTFFRPLLVEDFIVLPPTDLGIRMDYDTEVRVHISGLEDCDVILRRAQLVLLKTVLYFPSDPPLMEMNELFAENYSKLYRESHVNSKIAAELTDLLFLFDPQSIAQCELGVDRELGTTPPPPSTPSWWAAPFMSETPKEISQFVEEMESEEEQLPGRILIKIDIGQNWRVRLSHDYIGESALMDVRLHGAMVSGSFATRPVDGQTRVELAVESKGLTIFFSTNAEVPLLQLVSEDTQVVPVVLGLKYFKADREAGAVLNVTATVLPMTLTYLPGLARGLTDYFGFLSVQELHSGAELLATARASELYQSARALAPSTVGFDLSLAGPIIYLPEISSAKNSRVVISLGEMRLFVPNSVLDGTVDTPVATATLERVSVTAITEQLESVQVVAPTPIEFSGFYSHTDQLFDFTLAMDQALRCRVSPAAMRVFLGTVSIFSKEFANLTPPVIDAPRVDVPSVRIALVARIERVDLMISDGSTDALNFQVALPSINFALGNDGFVGSCDEIRVLARCLNSRVGDWEPVIEPSFYSAFAKIDSDSIAVKFRAISATNIVLSSETLKTVGWLTAALDRPVQADRYRVINASGSSVYISLQGVSSDRCLVEIPSSSSSVAIDALILPHGARDLIISASRELLVSSNADFSEARESGESPILRVPLNRFHAALLTNESDFLLVQSLTTKTDFRVVLISHNAFLFNECDVDLEIDSFGPLPTPATIWKKDIYLSEDKASLYLVIPPNCFASIPFSLLSFKMRPMGGDWSEQFIFESATVAPPMCAIRAGEMHFRIDSEFGETSLPLVARTYQVFLRPALRVHNYTPVELRLGSAQSLTPWSSLALHSFVPSTDPAALELQVGFPNLSTEWSPPLFTQSVEERHSISPEPAAEAAAELTFKTWGSGRALSIGVKWWLIDRTGWNVSVLQEGSVVPLVRGGPVFLLPDPDKPVLVSVCLGTEHFELALPDSGWCQGEIGSDHPIVFVSKETLMDKYVEIIPRYSIFNALIADPIFFQGDMETLPPGLGTTWHRDTLVFSLDGTHFSAPIPLAESSAGIWPIHVDGAGRVVRVEIAPVNGSINVTIREGSSILVRNEKRHKDVVIEVDRGQVFRIPPLSEKHVGWTDPFTSPVCEAVMRIGGKSFVVPLAKARDNVRYGGSVRIDPGDEPQSIVLVVEHKPDDIASASRLLRGKTLLGEVVSGESAANENVFGPRARAFRLEFHAAAVGLSLVRSGQELLYIELSLIRSIILQDEYMRRISFLVSDIQVDTGVSLKPVVLVNNGLGVKPFIETLVETSLQVSKGVVVVPTVDIQFDTLFVEVDSSFMAAMDDFLNDLMGTEIGLGSTMTRNATKFVIASLRPITRGTVRSIPVPSILVLDSLRVSPIEISLWVDFALSSMLFLPSSLKLVIGLLSLGGSFRLDGSNVGFKRRQVTNFKGTGIHFAQSIIQEYGNEALKNIANLLGSSSLLAIPRAPLQLVAGIGGFGLESATKAVGAFGNKIQDFASDAKYREAQAKIRKTKKIKGFADGFVEGANRLGEGAEGILDMFKKPVQGAQKGGLGGFFLGIGTGLVGTVVKPITKFGEAIGDMGTGIARSVQSANSGKPKFVRRRLPRPFYGRAAAVMQYREIDAFLYSALPHTQIGGFELVIPILTGVPLLHRSELLAVNVGDSPRNKSTSEITSLVLFESKLMAVKTQKFLEEIEREASPTVSLSPRSQVSVPETPTTVTASYSEATVVREVYLRQIREAYVSIPTRSINISDMFGGKAQFFLDLPASSNAGALLASIASAVAAGVGKGAFDWRETKRLFADAKLEDNEGAMSTSEGGKRCEVVEVERFLMTYGWRTPFLMLDTNTGWRWVDANMKRHSKIRQKIRRSDAAKSKLPPIDFGDLWTPIDEWKVVVDPDNTDNEGWQYALSFNSSTWQKHSGITASVRKRTWVRNYR